MYGVGVGCIYSTFALSNFAPFLSGIKRNFKLTCGEYIQPKIPLLAFLVPNVVICV